MKRRAREERLANLAAVSQKRKKIREEVGFFFLSFFFLSLLLLLYFLLIYFFYFQKGMGYEDFEEGWSSDEENETDVKRCTEGVRSLCNEVTFPHHNDINAINSFLSLSLSYSLSLLIYLFSFQGEEIFEDTFEDFSSLTRVLANFSIWRSRYIDAYKQVPLSPPPPSKKKKNKKKHLNKYINKYNTYLSPTGLLLPLSPPYPHPIYSY